MTVPDLPDADAVRAAAARLQGKAVATPLLASPRVDRRLGGRLLVKAETLQRTGSFKFRGAFNRIRQIAQEDRAKGVVAFSSGNHAQGVAAAAALFSMPALIVMPKDVPTPKLEGTRALGAEVVFYDRRTDDREAIALALCIERGATLVPPFDDFYVVAGQGTVGLEMARQAAARGVTLDAVLAPCSGGGLIGGIALAFSAISPATRIVSVEPECYDGMKRSLATGHRVVAPGGIPSVADALMAPVPGEIPFALATRHLHDSLTIGDSEFLAATAYAATSLKLLVEPSGVAGLAAVISGRFQTFGTSIGVVLTGANCDLAAISAASRRTG